ncbi:hypothetical protein SKAU_G00255200 [Synaphobranchus kaupii]|uniref:Uncharacterized protein n=1 Tax=Synaphobranchus kaupii TaxID=118154 RepID=A0A9Q1IS92_SYNKA|nr:hypothetical protein SKAU_G00255200 [Synaphobranchus kaupii]
MRILIESTVKKWGEKSEKLWLRPDTPKINEMRLSKMNLGKSSSADLDCRRVNYSTSLHINEPTIPHKLTGLNITHHIMKICLIRWTLRGLKKKREDIRVS